MHNAPAMDGARGRDQAAHNPPTDRKPDPPDHWYISFKGKTQKKTRASTRGPFRIQELADVISNLPSTGGLRVRNDLTKNWVPWSEAAATFSALVEAGILRPAAPRNDHRESRKRTRSASRPGARPIKGRTLAQSEDVDPANAPGASESRYDEALEKVAALGKKHGCDLGLEQRDEPTSTNDSDIQTRSVGTDGGYSSVTKPQPTADTATWYQSESRTKKVRQVVIEIPPGLERKSRFGELLLAGEHSEQLMRTRWGTGLFRLHDDPGPFLMVRGDDVVNKLRGSPFKVAFCFYRMKSGGLVTLYVYADCPAVAQQLTYPIVVFEKVYGCDADDVKNLVRDAIGRDSLHICFAEGEGPGETAGGKWSGSPIKAQFDVVVALPADCRAALEEELAALLDHHSSVPAGRRDFKRCGEEMWSENPQTDNPILPRKHSDSAAGTAATPQETKEKERETNAAVTGLGDELCFFCEQQPADTEIGAVVEMHGEVHKVYTGPGAYSLRWSHARLNIPRCKDCRDAHDDINRWTERCQALGALIGLFALTTLLVLWTGHLAGFVAGIILGLAVGAGLGGVVGKAIARRVISRRWTTRIKDLDARLIHPRIREKLAKQWKFGAEPSNDERINAPCTRAKFTYDDGAKYEGGWSNNDTHGRGVCTWPSGSRYEGEFLNGARTGRGIWTSSDGHRYEGEFLDGVRTGRGIYTWPNGERYEGEFLQNRRHGQGVHSWPNGNRYEGQFRKSRYVGGWLHQAESGDREWGFQNHEGKWTPSNEGELDVDIKADVPEEANPPEGAVSEELLSIRETLESTRDPKALIVTCRLAGFRIREQSMVGLVLESEKSALIMRGDPLVTVIYCEKKKGALQRTLLDEGRLRPERFK